MTAKAFPHHKKLACKKTNSSHEVYEQLLNASPNQMAFMRHIVRTKLGLKTNHFHPPLKAEDIELDPKELRQSGILQHLHSPHHLAEAYSEAHAKGGGFGSMMVKVGNKMVEITGKLAKKIGMSIKKAAIWAVKNPKKLSKIVETVAQGISVVSQIVSNKKTVRASVTDDDFTTDDEKIEKTGGSLLQRHTSKKVTRGVIRRKVLTL